MYHALILSLLRGGSPPLICLFITGILEVKTTTTYTVWVLRVPSIQMLLEKQVRQSSQKKFHKGFGLFLSVPVGNGFEVIVMVTIIN